MTPMSMSKALARHHQAEKLRRRRARLEATRQRASLLLREDQVKRLKAQVASLQQQMQLALMIPEEIRRSIISELYTCVFTSRLRAAADNPDVQRMVLALSREEPVADMRQDVHRDELIVRITLPAVDHNIALDRRVALMMREDRRRYE